MKTLIGIALMWGLLMAVRYGLISTGLYSLPAAIVSLGILTVLALAWRPLADLLEPGAGTLIEYMPLFFIPVLVGVMAQQDLLLTHWFVVLFAVVGASLIGLLSAAYTYRFVIKHITRNGTATGGAGHD